MKLKEKFEEVFIENWLSDYSEECKKIADEFAIGFAEWIEELSSSNFDSLNYHLYLDNNVKELLEIYKKEKGY